MSVRPPGPGAVPLVYAKTPETVVICKNTFKSLAEVVTALRASEYAPGVYDYLKAAQALTPNAESTAAIAKSLEKFAPTINGL